MSSHLVLIVSSIPPLLEIFGGWFHWCPGLVTRDLGGHINGVLPFDDLFFGPLMNSRIPTTKIRFLVIVILFPPLIFFALLMHDSHCCLVVVLDVVVDALWLCTGVLDWMGLFGGMGVGETLERFRSRWHLARSTPIPTGFLFSTS